MTPLLLEKASKVVVEEVETVALQGGYAFSIQIRVDGTRGVGGGEERVALTAAQGCDNTCRDGGDGIRGEGGGEGGRGGADACTRRGDEEFALAMISSSYILFRSKSAAAAAAAAATEEETLETSKSAEAAAISL
eukprot:CAMPEP_0175067766 /NCGR_PEP_ID=MMETSP0052_2-20121109/17286_1 /TAXON_ID=51329 ORGANISM="Polytomella parva, Strain SAG 63-3" /NCGR_SAMPLE_ID=MMETSP0052_2 /ASSEMBLY_ACC=CAM_ASM_000194 /LENGTH=134 /DNA_ID=CAMNT_0016334695 /DNA_START=283 /DNA_END=688 /DNA_ORIENTATION=-